MAGFANQPGLADLPRPERRVPAGTISAATEAARGTIEIATQAEVDAGTDNTRAVTPAGLVGFNITRNYSVTHTSDTALATRASGGTQIGATISNARIPTAGVVRITLLEGEFDETEGNAAEFAFALDIGGTKVWAAADTPSGVTTDFTVRVNTSAASRLIGAGVNMVPGNDDPVPVIMSFDIAAGSFPTGTRDIQIYFGDNANGALGEVTVTGTTVTCRILVEVIDFT